MLVVASPSSLLSNSSPNPNLHTPFSNAFALQVRRQFRPSIFT